MRKAAWALTVMSAVLWGFAGAATWGDVDQRALSIEANAAAGVMVLAGLCWVGWAVRDRDKDVLVDAWAAVSSRRAAAPTRPERRLRRVG